MIITMIIIMIIIIVIIIMVIIMMVIMIITITIIPLLPRYGLCFSGQARGDPEGALRVVVRGRFEQQRYHFVRMSSARALYGR